MISPILPNDHLRSCNVTVHNILFFFPFICFPFVMGVRESGVMWLFVGSDMAHGEVTGSLWRWSEGCVVVLGDKKTCVGLWGKSKMRDIVRERRVGCCLWRKLKLSCGFLGVLWRTWGDLPAREESDMCDIVERRNASHWELLLVDKWLVEMRKWKKLGRSKAAVSWRIGGVALFTGGKLKMRQWCWLGIERKTWFAGEN